MIFFNLQLLPKEHVLSWLLRGYVRSGSVSFSSFQEQMSLKATKLYANQVFGRHIEGIIKLLGNRQRLLSNHTNALLWQVSVGNLVEHDSPDLDSFEHMNEQQFFGYDTSWHACQSCIKEDMERYGTSYWHAPHQYPSFFTCYKHSKPLVISKEPIKNIYSEVLPHNVAAWEYVVPEVKQELKDWQSYLKEVISLCHNNPELITQIKPKIVKYFDVSKLKSKEQKLYCEDLNFDFEQAMGQELLRYLFRDYRRENLRGKTNVFKILLIGDNKVKGVRNPIYWLTVAYWLKISKQLDVLS